MKLISSVFCAMALVFSAAVLAEETPMVNINSAGPEALAELEGVGPKKADAIADWRDQNGEFVSVDQLAEVQGIGEATVDANRERMSLE